MATTACFIIVSRNDIPIYEAEVGVAAKREDAAQLHQFILHAALDIVQDLAWTTSAMYLKSVDRFNDLVVSVYVTAGHTRFMLLHDSRNDDGIKSFFQEVHELYIKVLCAGISILINKFSCLVFSQRNYSYTHCSWDTKSTHSPSTLDWMWMLLWCLRKNGHFLIPCTCLAPGSHHHILTRKSELLPENICRVHQLAHKH
ncbi:trafficking protein particle complex subunit 2 isoform X1 [Arachis ipaensis]|uniref:trafficking protein particle complex subunit 2 isoform X1 n=1 Tax=Arachis ipaensis TaxID=130454 RepID=UPI000A2B3BE5|nr:trafficking protein particle complex subunit 2 isoform X1 [Arachis ipaensis]XP_020965774.1 trafficking protein particle complex subunit 2 isoform X1 [Arachis ipaensis]